MKSNNRLPDTGSPMWLIKIVSDGELMWDIIVKTSVSDYAGMLRKR